MNLTSNDYKTMICARTDWVRMALYPQQYGAAPQAVANNGYNPPETVPDFEKLKVILGELTELANEFETSLSPA